MDVDLTNRMGSFPWVNAPYEAPSQPELILKSAEATPDVLAEQVLSFLHTAGKLAK